MKDDIPEDFNERLIKILEEIRKNRLALRESYRNVERAPNIFFDAIDRDDDVR